MRWMGTHIKASGEIAAGDERVEHTIRRRALITFSVFFIVLQGVNFATLAIFYDGWLLEMLVSAGAILLAILAIATAPHAKSFEPHAIGITLFFIVANSYTAIPDGTGINTSLLPLMCVIPLVNGFIGGARAAVGSSAAVLGFIALLYHVSITAPNPAPEYYLAWSGQRAIQACLAVVMVATISSVFGRSVVRAFAMLEERAEAARAAEQTKSVFIGTMSHEIRTPLNAMLGFAQTLQHSDLTPEQRRDVQLIQSSGHQLLSMVTDILELSKLTTEKVVPDPQPTKVTEWMEEVISPWVGEAESKGLRLVTRVSSDVGESALLDARRAGKALTQLISNAVKFSEKGEISVELSYARQESDGLLITVRDQGIGIPADALHRVILPLEQVEYGSDRRFDGAGLGLTLAHHLTNAIGGTLTISSRVDVGTVVRLLIPATAAASAPGKTDNPSSEDTRVLALSTARVLVVEDNRINQLVIGQLLKMLDITPEFANDGHECLAALAAGEYDIILMDKHMPGMDGVEATHRIRAMEGSVKDIPIIACTADAMDGEREALLAKGFSDFIAKPVSLEDLRAALKRARRAGSQTRPDRVAA